MGGNYYIFAFVGLLAAMMVAAAISDIRHRIITNRLNAAIALLAVPYWFLVGLDPWPDMALQIGIAMACFAFFAIPFAMGKMGGGDVKFITAISLWLVPVSQNSVASWIIVLKFLIVMSLAGAVLTLFMIVYERVKNKSWNPKVPYGVSIAFGGLWVLHQQYINQFV